MKIFDAQFLISQGKIGEIFNANVHSQLPSQHFSRVIFRFTGAFSQNFCGMEIKITQEKSTAFGYVLRLHY